MILFQLIGLGFVTIMAFAVFHVIVKDWLVVRYYQKHGIPYEVR